MATGYSRPDPCRYLGWAEPVPHPIGGVTGLCWVFLAGAFKTLYQSPHSLTVSVACCPMVLRVSTWEL